MCPTDDDGGHRFLNLLVYRNSPCDRPLQEYEARLRQHRLLERSIQEAAAKVKNTEAVDRPVKTGNDKEERDDHSQHHMLLLQERAARAEMELCFRMLNDCIFANRDTFVKRSNELQMQMQQHQHQHQEEKDVQGGRHQ